MGTERRVIAAPPFRHQRTDGSARVAFRRSRAATTLEHLYQEGAPKIRLPRTTKRAEAILINTAGGLTGGDRLAWRIDAHIGTEALITTQTCEKIYRSLDGQPAVVETHISVGPGARLDWLPQETILFNRSALRRSLDAELATDASLLAVEAVIFGRHAMGENVSQAWFHDRWRIRRAGRLVFADDLRFEGPVSSLLTRPAVAGGGRACATILYVATDTEPCADRLRKAVPDIAASAFDGKLLARVIAGDAYRLRQVLVPALELLSIGRELPKAWAL
jgi:urease accessory protein